MLVRFNEDRFSSFQNRLRGMVLRDGLSLRCLLCINEECLFKIFSLKYKCWLKKKKIFTHILLSIFKFEKQWGSSDSSRFHPRSNSVMFLLLMKEYSCILEILLFFSVLLIIMQGRTIANYSEKILMNFVSMKLFTEKKTYFLKIRNTLEVSNALKFVYFWCNF